MRFTNNKLLPDTSSEIREHLFRYVKLFEQFRFKKNDIIQETCKTKVSELERLNVKTVDYKLFRNLSVSDRHH